MHRRFQVGSRNFRLNSPNVQSFCTATKACGTFQELHQPWCQKTAKKQLPDQSTTNLKHRFVHVYKKMIKKCALYLQNPKHIENNFENNFLAICIPSAPLKMSIAAKRRNLAVSIVQEFKQTHQIMVFQFLGHGATTGCLLLPNSRAQRPKDTNAMGFASETKAPGGHNLGMTSGINAVGTLIKCAVPFIRFDQLALAKQKCICICI